MLSGGIITCYFLGRLTVIVPRTWLVQHGRSLRGPISFRTDTIYYYLGVQSTCQPLKHACSFAFLLRELLNPKMMLGPVSP